MMIALSFIVFFALVIAWLAAPNAGAHDAPVPEAAPRLSTSEATA